MIKSSRFSISDPNSFLKVDQNAFILNSFTNYQHNWNHSYPGNGKSFTLRVAIFEQLTGDPTFKILIIVPTIHNLNEWMREFMVLNIEYQKQKRSNRYPKIDPLLIGGKTTYTYTDKNKLIESKYLITKKEYKRSSIFSSYEKLCQKDDGSEYDDGCKDCSKEMKEVCLWKKQFQKIRTHPVVICTPFQSAMITDKRFVAVDDSFETFPFLEQKFKNKEELEKFGVKFHLERSIPFRRKNRTSIRPEDFFRFYDAKFKRISFKNVPTDDPTYHQSGTFLLLKWFLQSTERYKKKRYAYIDTKQKVHLFGYRECVPENYEGMLFNSGTITKRVLYFITHTTKQDWGKPFNSPKQYDQIKNLMIQLPFKWNKNRQRYVIQKDPNFLAAIKSLANEKEPILIIGKKEFMTMLQKSIPKTQYPLVDFVHYNAGRGFNDCNKPYKFIIVYGSYRFTPITKMQYKLLGFTNGMINDLELAEMYEAVYRARLLTEETEETETNEHTPIFLFTDRLFPKAKKIILSMKILLQILQKFRSYEDFDELTNTQLCEVLQVKSHVSKKTIDTIRTVIDILKFRLDRDSIDFSKINLVTEDDEE